MKYIKPVQGSTRCHFNLSLGISLLIIAHTFFATLAVQASQPSSHQVDTSTILSLSATESSWLAEHMVWRVGVDADFAPFEFYDQQGNHAGIGAEYLQIVADKLGVKLEFVKNLSWEQVLAGIQGHSIDVLSVAAITPNRLDYLVFSKPYLKFPSVIVCRRGESVGKGLGDFVGRKVALVRGYALTELVMSHYPSIQPVFVENALEGLSLVATNKVDGFVGDLATVTYKINEFHLGNVKVAATVKLGTLGFSMSARKDWRLLPGIFDKVIATITVEQRQEISRRWLQNTSLPSHDNTTELQNDSFPVLKVGITLCLFLVLLVLFFALFRGIKQQIIISQSDFQRQSNNSQKVIIYFNIILVIWVGVLSWWALGSIKEKTVADWRKSMVTVRDTVQEAVTFWVKVHSVRLRYIAADPQLVTFVQEQIVLHKDQKSLFSPQLSALRKIFIGLQSEYEHIGFFVISPDGTNIGSLRDSNMGDSNLIGTHRPDLLARAFAGETVLIPPIPSDVPLGKSKVFHGGVTPPTMFFATPVKDKNGKVIAVLTERFDPHGEFSNFFALARLGQSGETYAFDQQGRFLSSSRYHDELSAIGLIDSHEQCILSITTRDPTSDSAKLTHMAASAIKGQTGTDTKGYNDYRGVPVFGAWTWNKDLGLGIACEIDASEAMQSYYQARMALFITLLVTLLMISTFLWLNRRMAYRLGQALSRSHKELEDLVLSRTKQLTHAKNEQDLIFATMSDALFVQDEQGRITFINLAAVELLGYGKNELLGCNMHDTLHHSNIDGSPIPAETCEMHCLVKDGTPVDNEVLWHKDGYAVPVEYTSRLIIQDDKPNGIVVVCHDISDRLVKQESLKEREAQLRFILDSAPIAVGISNEQKELVFGNRCLFEQVRIKLGAQTETAFVDPAQRVALIKRLNREGIVKNIEIKLFAPDGSAVDTLATYIRSEYQGKPAVIAWFYDISMQKQAELRIDQARQLAEDANRTKSEFLANMSHELRTPLNAIIGMGQLALQGDLNEKQYHYIDSVCQSGEILLALINDILDFSRIEAGGMDLEEKSFVLADIFTHLDQVLSFKAKEKGVDLVFSQATDLPLTVVGDKLRLSQILTNLLTNAIKFTDEGKVEVSASIRKQQYGVVTLLYQIQDTGVGMKAEEQQRLFHPFTQADNSVARRYGGSGLGLVICKYLVEMMGGSIWLQSKRGEGTTFSFTVDLSVSKVDLLSDSQKGGETQQEEATKCAIARLKGLKILLAEDNDFNRDLATELLASNGLQVVSAINGLEVLELLKLHDFDGVLMDCQMPEMDGYTATREIRKLPEYQNLPILAMTANAMEEDRKRSLDVGMNDHICKPINLNELFTTMDKWFVKKDVSPKQQE